MNSVTLSEVQLFFNIPSEATPSEYSSRLTRVIKYILEINVDSAETQFRFEEMARVLHCSLNSDVYPARSRRSLFSNLQDYPFYSTLMMIDEPTGIEHDNSISNRRLALLAHLFLCRGAADYPAHLEFYKCFVKRENMLFSMSFILSATVLELQLAINSLSKINEFDYLKSISSFLKKLKKTHLNSRRRGITQAANQHKTELLDNDDVSLHSIELSSANGTAIGGRFEMTAKIPLTTAQARRKFQRYKTGMANAAYSVDAGIAGSMLAAIPKEVGQFLDAVSPELMECEFGAIAPESAGMLLVFFLNTLGIARVFELELVNLGAKTFSNRHQVQHAIVYQFNRNLRHIDSAIILNAALLQTQPARTENKKIHYVSNNQFKLILPFPIGTLLNIALRNLDPQFRHQKTLAEALKISTSEYQSWVRQGLNAAGLLIRGINKSVLENAFHHYSRELVPETYRNFLRGSASVQNHYVSVEQSKVFDSVVYSWRNFCAEVGFTTQTFNTHEVGGNSTTIPPNTEIGSKLTVRSDVLRTILAGLVQSFDNVLHEPALLQNLNRIALYLYLRIATTVGLRPTKQPLPKCVHIHREMGGITVADKRTHYHDERRLIVLPPQLLALLCSHEKVVKSVALNSGVPIPTALLMHFNAAEKSWQHFDQALVNQQLLLITNKPIINRSCRHSAAKRFIEHHVTAKTFSQSAVDLLLNHSRSGVSALNNLALCSPALVIKKQCDFITAYDRENNTMDMKLGDLLNSMLGGGKC